MSYAPENQEIDEPLRKIIEGIREFSSATDERILSESGTWLEEHLTEIGELRIKLLQLMPEIKKQYY